MSILEAIILGVVQGLAEFLPVSSSGHLQIAKEVLGVRLTDNLTFDVMLHLATVLATVVVLWREVAGLFSGLFAGLRTGLTSLTGLTSWRSTPEKRLGNTPGTQPETTPETRFETTPGTSLETTPGTARKRTPETGHGLNSETIMAGKLLLSAVPVAAVGLLLRDRINAMLASPAILLIVGLMLLLTAALLVFAGRARTTKNLKSADRKGNISWRDAFIIGVAQAAAAMPGLSRSGSTIATGLLLGRDKAAVAQFSFLMVIIPIVGEALLDVLRGGFGGDAVGGIGAMPLFAGFAAAFITGCLACRLMIEMVKRARLTPFAIYCAVVGAAAIIWYLT